MGNLLIMMIIGHMEEQMCRFIYFLTFLTFNHMQTTLNIASYNCQDAKFRNYDYIKDIFSKCDISV